MLWLEADWGIDDPLAIERVSQWLDRSGYNNHAVQLDATHAPRLVAAGIAGRPTVRFTDLTWMVVIDKLSMRWGLEDFVLLFVERRAPTCPGCQSPQIFFHKSEENLPWTGTQFYLTFPSGKFQTYLSDNQTFYTSSGGYNDNNAHLAGVRRTAANVEIRVDGVVAGSTPTISGINLDAPGRHGIIGAHGYNGNQFQFEGDMAAMVAVRGSLADADLARLERYLRVKYAIAEGTPPGQ